MNQNAIYRHELHIALRGTWFTCAFAVSLILSFAAAIESYCLLSYRLSLDSFYLSHRSAWANWIVVNAQGGALSTVFFTIAPLLAVVPYAWSFHADRLSGYAAQVITRVPRGSYLRAKMIAAFCSGSLTVGAGLIFNILVLIALLPANVPFYEDSIIIGVFSEDPFSFLFYNVPFVYTLVYTAVDMAVLGCWSMFVLGLSSVFKNRLSVLIAPYILLYGWHVANTKLVSRLNALLPSMNIIDDLDASHFIVITEPASVVLQVGVMLVCSYLCCRVLSRGDCL